MLKWIKNNTKWAVMFVLGVALIAVYKTFDSFDYLSTIFSKILDAAKPFIIAFVIAYLLNIPAKKLTDFIVSKAKSEKLKKHANAISIAVIYILFVIAIVAVLGALLPALYRNIMDMYDNLPQFAGSIVQFLNNIEILEKIGFKADTINVMSMISDVLNVGTIGKYAQGVMSFTSGLLDVFIALIASIYMLLEKERILKGINRIISLFARSDGYITFMEHCSSVNAIFTQYIYARLICCVVMAAVCTLVLLIMGEKYALLLGMFIGFMDMIPYFGSIISWVVSGIVMLISGGTFHAIWCLIILLVLQQLDGNVLAPKIMGTRLEISPLTIIIAVSVGGTLFGFVGMLISVPVVAILRATISELLEVRANAIRKASENEDNDEAEYEETVSDANAEDIDGDGETEDAEE
ncbi:MAG: AI-2E family transporter [Candidatus Ornithomonoglobus sp.]